MLVIADLLGVPEDDHADVRASAAARRRARGAIGSTATTLAAQPARVPLRASSPRTSRTGDASPRDDVLTGLATATFPDGSTPEVIDVVRIAANLFAAGQETTVRLLGTALQLILAERPELQQLLRDDRDLHPELHRGDPADREPGQGRLPAARVTTTVGGVEIPAGTTVMVVNGAANRDPRRFERPHEFRVDRANARQHIAFGTASTPAPARRWRRAEARVSIERLLDRTTDIRISEAAHGPAGARRYEYVPTYILRGLRQVQPGIRLTEAGPSRATAPWTGAAPWFGAAPWAAAAFRSGQNARAIRASSGPLLGSVAMPSVTPPKCSPAAQMAMAVTTAMATAGRVAAGASTPAAARPKATVKIAVMAAARVPPPAVSTLACAGACSSSHAMAPHRMTHASLAPRPSGLPSATLAHQPGSGRSAASRHRARRAR